MGAGIAAKLREKAGASASEREIFLAAFHSVKGDSKVAFRLETFIALYGAHRNMVFALAVVLVIWNVVDFPPFIADTSHFEVSSGLAVAIVFGFLRYYKFFRLCTEEALRSHYFKIVSEK